MRFGDGTRYPTNSAHDINEDSCDFSTWNVNHTVEFSSPTFKVELREDDDSSKDDSLDSFNVKNKPSSGQNKCQLDDGDYTVYWKVEATK